MLAIGTAAADEIDSREFAVVGTWGNLTNWSLHESRLWGDVLPTASDGKITANAKPYTELGLSGYEVVKLLKLGAYDAVHALTTYTSQDSPALEGIDLAGVFQDMDTYRRALQAYRPIIERELKNKYDAELVMLYTFPSQMLWCKLGDAETVRSRVWPERRSEPIPLPSATSSRARGVCGDTVLCRGCTGAAKGCSGLRHHGHGARLQRQMVAGGDPQHPDPSRLRCDVHGGERDTGIRSAMLPGR